jgi:hypothetical protein
MLADTILSEVGGGQDRILRGGITALAGTIKRAARFDLTPGMIASARAVKNSPLSTQIKALPLCRFPFEVTWFEWSCSDTVLQHGETNDTFLPKRVGCLVIADASRQRGAMTFSWVHATSWSQSAISICPLSVTFDWTENTSDVYDIGRDFSLGSGVMTKEGIQEKLVAQARERLASAFRHASDKDILADCMRFGMVWCPFLASLGDQIVQAKGALPGPGTQEWLRWEEDLQGEPGIVRAVVMLLNSRNAVHSEHVGDFGQLNKKRARKGRPPLLGYTTVRIKLSHSLAIRAASIEDRDLARLHVVRGHFKVRSSGVYWWSDHQRGDASHGTLSHSYRVEE